MSEIAPLAFTVVGTPAPQGSKRHVGGGRMVEMSKRLPAWREDVTNAALDAVAAHPSGGKPVFPRGQPVELHVVFRRRLTIAAEKLLAKGVETVPASPPDASKLIRALEDACTLGGVWADDGQVGEIHCYRRWAWGPNLPGASVIVQMQSLSQLAAEAAESVARVTTSAREAAMRMRALTAAAAS